VPELIRAAGGVPWTGAPRGTRIGHVHLYVADLADATAFYHSALGFDKVVLEFPGAQFFSAGGYHHHVGTNTWAAGAARAAETDARLLEWTIQLPAQDDVEVAARSLAGAGHAVRREAGAAIAVDPWGTAVRISAAG
jgi:catechol 2,3-dioxygenase